MIESFKVGQMVSYRKTYKPELVTSDTVVGRITKLHDSGKSGSAEIRPLSSGKKVTRKLSRLMFFSQ